MRITKTELNDVRCSMVMPQHRGDKELMELPMCSDKLVSPPKAQARQIVWWATLVLLGLNVAACSTLPKSPLPEIQATPPVACAPEQHEIERLQKLLAEQGVQQQEIERLQKLLAEKEAQIRTQQVRQQDQAKTLQKTSSQAAHAQVKLRRLATRPAAASTIAEAEMVMDNLESSPITAAEQILQTQAQRMLNAATASYAEDNYGAAMDHAAQASEFIDMIKSNRSRKASDPRHVSVSLQVPIPLRVTANSNLRQQPSLSATVLGVIKKDSAITAEAYRGDWLQVQTADGRSGWVLNTLVEAQVGQP
jgi:uncharacterized protein YgiM (DUF1202 family)